MSKGHKYKVNDDSLSLDSSPNGDFRAGNEADILSNCVHTSGILVSVD